MKKKLFVLLAVIMVLLMVSMSALATPPDNNVQGRWCYGYFEEGEHKIAGGNEFYDMDSSDAWIVDEGYLGFSGFSESFGRVQVHPSGYTLLKTDTFLDPVTVDGRTGTLEMKVNGWLPVGGDLSDYEGLWVITTGTGELKGLQGRGTWGGVESNNPKCLDIDNGFLFSVPYSGSVHFEGD